MCVCDREGQRKRERERERSECATGGVTTHLFFGVVVEWSCGAVGLWVCGAVGLWGCGVGGRGSGVVHTHFVAVDLAISRLPGWVPVGVKPVVKRGVEVGKEVA